MTTVSPASILKTPKPLSSHSQIGFKHAVVDKKRQRVSEEDESSSKENKMSQNLKLTKESSRLNNQQTKKQIELPNHSTKEMMLNNPPIYGYPAAPFGQIGVPQTNIFSAFNEELKTVSSPDSRRIQNLTQLAKECHSKYALLVANALEYKITSSPNKLAFVCIMDSILKNVQGEYIRLFESKIATIFESAFEAASMDEKRSLLKMFLIWDLFFTPQTLHTIRDRHQLHEYERRLLNEADFEKVRRFRREFEPSFLPDEVLQSGRFISGSESQSNQAFRGMPPMTGDPRMMNQPPQGQIPPYGGVHYGGQMEGYGAGVPPSAIQTQQPHLQMPGHSNFSNTGPTPQPTYGGPQPSATQSRAHLALELLNKVSTRGPPQIDHPRQTPVPQIQPQQPAGYYGSTPIYPQGYQNPQIGGYGQQQMQAQFHGDRQGLGRNAYAYPSSHIDDNFHLKTDQTQFGFLPTILKSFQSFKSNQQLLLGQDQRLHGMLDSALPPTFDKFRTLRELNFFAINEVYEGVKFQCAICGMRFIRNMMLKKHLDLHFNKNNEMRRKGNRAVSRPQFQTFKDFIQPKNSLANQRGGGQGGPQGQRINEELVPYSNKDTQCYICKEQFETFFDEDEELWYFVGAKQVRASSSKQPGSKQILTVHSDCLKQIELNRDLQKQLKELTNTASAEEAKVTDTLEVKEKEVQEPKYQKEETRIDIEELERQIRGIQSSKRQFITN